MNRVVLLLCCVFIFTVLFAGCGETEQSLSGRLEKKASMEEKQADTRRGNNKIVVGVIEMEPFMGEKLTGYGLYSELVTAAMAEEGYEVQYVFSTYNRNITLLETGQEIDAVPNVTYSDDRTAAIEFPQDFLYENKKGFVTVKGKEVKFDQDWSVFKPYVIGFTAGSIDERVLKAAGLTTEGLAGNDLYQFLQQLLASRVDYLYYNLDSVKYVVKNKLTAEQAEKIIFIDPPAKRDKQYVAFAKNKKDIDAKKLAEAFDRGLKKIKENGTYEKIVSKYGL